ncbi:tRNA pseudouridine(38-40) synthase TruA [Helicobacter suis]|uniref:tRNA pseudouridine synthase A n=1 Tax=Helicobacter suis TaxID=104628 RepID=A0ABM7L1R2_9HELI|nr:tRNA pseudouridine(38-40) synthase TruA [Helicobacter suis]EFX43672.1 tRNA pseudouridine synthase A [Helicobacter suis HS1]BCD46588.1 tRNA pseudouridine synthase A [Helicobacter suis]BCD47503.1 tRNA pseudouridine synthase A [Helicobacter suis]BCD49257.1 tRNA pseudouridine synthase A [Helicobacter suis]BCD51290.1 tRNA pseudouridine synthase A [Helicobacter suis]
MRRFKLVLAYDGSAFSGFAKQAGLYTVEGRLIKALESLQIPSKILAAGRTDRGVHATHQVIAFNTCDIWSSSKLLKHLAPKLGYFIACKSLEEVPLSFHPRFEATRRRYRYFLSLAKPSPFLSRFVGYHPCGDMGILKQALELFKGEHDFKFFSKSGSDPKSTIRSIYKAFCYPYMLYNLPCLVLVFEANSFLRSQVRLMLGAALACSLKQISLEDLYKQITLQRRFLMRAVSPSGLYLSSVFY